MSIQTQGAGAGESLPRPVGAPRNRVSRHKRILLAVFAAALLGLGALLCPIGYFVYEAGIRHPTTYSFALDTKTQITEASALDLTKRALELDGWRSSGLQPVRLSEGNPDKTEVYLKRDAGEKPVGYVRWRNGKWDLSVKVERQTGGAVCTVYVLE